MDSFEVMRRESRVREPKAKRRPKPKPKPVWPPLPDPQQDPREPHPWETPDFDPGDPALVARLEGAPSPVIGFMLGAAPKILDGERWVRVQNPTPWWTRRIWLCYPLPERFGPDHLQAAAAFCNEMRIELARRRSWEDLAKQEGRSP